MITDSGITLPESATVYDTVSGTVTFNDSDVQKLFVDWGDGSDRTLENGINQWIDLEKPSDTATISHIYTATGSYSPIIRTVNTRGFVSKYYGSGATNTDLVPYESVGSRIGVVEILDGNPISEMKIENKTVLSGIDNNIFKEGPKDVYIQPIPTISVNDIESGLLTTLLYLRVECLTAVLTSPKNTALGYETKLQTITHNFQLKDKAPHSDNEALRLNTSELQPIIKILKISFLTPKGMFATGPVEGDIPWSSLEKTSLNLFNKLKIFLIAKSDDGNFYPITYVTSGDPIKSLKDKRRNVTLDFSQSRAKASNVSLSGYTIDNGKTFFQAKEQWQAATSSSFTDATKVVDSLINEQYTNTFRPDGLKGTTELLGSGTVALTSGNYWLYSGGTATGFDSKMRLLQNQYLINEFNQFYDNYYLTRLVTTTDSDKKNDLDTFNLVCSIVSPTTISAPDGYFINRSSGSVDSTSAAYFNTSTFPVSTSRWNDYTYEDSQDNDRYPETYFLLGNTTKTNKIFFNMTPYVQSNYNPDSTAGNEIKGLFYLRVFNEKFGDKFTQKAEWMPLEFTDTTSIQKEEFYDSDLFSYNNKTTSLVKNGYITFDTPSDWSQVSIQDLCGGFFNYSGAYSSATKVTGDYSKHLPGLSKDAVVASSSTQPFDWVTLSGASIGSELADYTDDDIGSYKYLFQVSGNFGEANEVYWVASSSIANNKIFIVSGASSSGDDFFNWTSTNGYIRRINIYDVVDGASKTGRPNSGYNCGLPPNYIKEGDGDSSYYYRFMFGGNIGDTSLTAAAVSGAFQNIYPLKMVISGSAFDNNSYLRVNPGDDTGPNQEMWNIIPFSNSFSQVVREVDNTAYDLTYMEITSDVSVTYGGSFYQAITKGGTVFIVRTGTPIQTISFNGTAMGDETKAGNTTDGIGALTYGITFGSSYYVLRKLRKIEAERIRVMWDEQQKDGTFVRFFGFVTDVSETHKVGGSRTTRPYTFDMVVEEICLMNQYGMLLTGLEPLGGIPDARGFRGGGTPEIPDF